MKWLFWTGVLLLPVLYVFANKSSVRSTLLLLAPAAAVTMVFGWLAHEPLLKVALATSPILMIILIDNSRGIVNVVAYVLPLLTVFGVLYFLQMRQERLLEQGAPAVAKVLEVVDNDTMVGVDAVVTIRMEVRPPKGAPYRAEATVPMSRLGMDLIQPDMLLNVKYDPEHPTRVAVESVHVDTGAEPAPQ